MKKPESVKCTPRSARVQPFYVMELLEKAQVLEAQGKHVVHMEIGEPDFTTPTVVKEAALKAIEEGRTFYTHSLGLKALRERIAAHYAESHATCRFHLKGSSSRTARPGPFFSSAPSSSIAGETS